MKTQIALASVSLSLLGGLVSVSSAEAAGLFSDGDSLSGSAGGTGLFNLANADEVPGAVVYFGTDVTGPGINIPAGGFLYAEITNPSLAPGATADTTINLPSRTGIFTGIDDGEFRSFVAQAPGTNNLADFLSLTGPGGLTIDVDFVNSTVESEPTETGDGILFEIDVVLTGELDGDIQVVDGIFRLSTENAAGDPVALIPNVIDPDFNGEGVLTLLEQLPNGGQGYSWQLEVVKNVPEPSSMVSLLALSALGAGMAMKRKVSK
ncbi:MAG: PEP-CTERM sorting domain-containing protein [Crocosphaera sp.]